VETYDAIVVGVGGVGSSAVCHLAQRGLSVLGLDRFPPGHDQGSSHGQTRIIRQAYFEHPDYVPLLRQAYIAWSDLEQAVEKQLYYPVGILEAGPPDGAIVPGVLDSASRFGLDVHSLSHEEAMREFPFQLPADMTAVFERDAGYLLVEECVKAHAQVAIRHGAELRSDEPVLAWTVDGSRIEVTTEKATYQTERLVIASGAWSNDLLGSLGIELRVLRKHLHWMDANSSRFSAKENCPVFFFEVPEGHFYGFPAIDERGIKLAEHSGGEEITDPLAKQNEIDKLDRARISNFAANYFGPSVKRFTDHATCLYTMTHDEHFIVDSHPNHSGIAFAAGLCGHGFKFTSVLGQILADLVITGDTELPIDFLRSSRPGLKPNSDLP